MAKKPVKDMFNLWQIEGDTLFSGKYELPYIHGTDKVPSELIPFSKSKNINATKDKAIHFYEHDEKFKSSFTDQNKLNLLISTTFAKYQSIILPDFSVYRDFPLALQIFQTYMSRAAGSYLEKHGISVIPNIRWADERSYEFVFDGIRHKSLISVGVLGAYRNKKSQYYFEKGFYKMLEIIEPSKIITYGHLPNPIIFDCENSNIEIISFNTDISLRYKKHDANNDTSDLFS